MNNTTSAPCAPYTLNARELCGDAIAIAFKNETAQNIVIEKIQTLLDTDQRAEVLAGEFVRAARSGSIPDTWAAGTAVMVMHNLQIMARGGANAIDAEVQAGVLNVMNATLPRGGAPVDGDALSAGILNVMNAA